LLTVVVEAEADVGGVSQSEGSGSHSMSSLVNSSSVGDVGVVVGGHEVAVGDGRSHNGRSDVALDSLDDRVDSVGVSRGDDVVDSVGVSGGDDLVDSVGVSSGDDAVMDSGDTGVEESRVGFGVSFTLVDNVLKVSVLGDILGETKSLAKWSGLSSVVDGVLVVGDYLGGWGNSLGGIGDGQGVGVIG